MDRVARSSGSINCPVGLIPPPPMRTGFCTWEQKMAFSMPWMLRMETNFGVLKQEEPFVPRHGLREEKSFAQVRMERFTY